MPGFRGSDATDYMRIPNAALKGGDWTASILADTWTHPREHVAEIVAGATAIATIGLLWKANSLRLSANLLRAESVPGAIVRPWLASDLAACDAIASATKMGTFIPGGRVWVLETPAKQVIGYTSLANNCWADIAVLPGFRANTRLLANTALGEMRAAGGTWFANAKQSTGLPFMLRLEESGLIKITEHTRGFGPYDHIKFSVH